ncbi:MAG: hypothetical protein ACREDR_25570, partial [Blastocatellia bacterium]
FDSAVKIALGLLYFGLVLGFIQTLSLWRQFRRLLHRLAPHPIAEAFDRLPSGSPHFIGQFWGRLPRVEQLQRPAQELSVLLKRYPSFDTDLKKRVINPTPSPDEISFEDQFAEKLEAEASEPRLRRWFLFAIANGGSASGAALVSGEPSSPEGILAAKVKAYVEVVEPLWAYSLPCPPRNESGPKDDSEPSHNAGPERASEFPPDVAEGKKLAEDLIAAQIVAFIVRIFARLRNLLSFVMASAFLILFGVKSYPFQPQQLLSFFMWAVIISVVAASVAMLIQAERDEVLSRIAKTDPNQINLDSRFVSGIVTYGVVPLAGLLLTEIPQLQGIFSFIEPILRAFK